MIVALAGAATLAGCGGSGNADTDQAIEQRIQRERSEAALVAKQEERIKQLERQQRDARRATDRKPSVTVVGRAPAQPTSQPASAQRSDDWPGGSGYTTILASLGTQADARRFQTTASGRGLDAGVLYSTNDRSLRPGYWVVFSGTSSSKQDADGRTLRAKSLGYSDAYPRFVSG
jgi:cell division septation protein DedD